MNFLRSIDTVWISLGPILVITLILLTSLLYFLATRDRWPVPSEVKTRPNSKFLSGVLKHWWYWNNEPIGKFFMLLFFLLLGLIGSMAVSYTRARGEAVGVDVKKGSMQRPERIVYLGCASIFEPMTTYGLNFIWPVPPPVLVIAAIVLIGVMTNVTAVYRMIYVMNELDNREKAGIETLPKMLSRLTTPEGREKLRSEWKQKKLGS